MKIAIIGSKGIPARYGGFETFAEQISYKFEDEGHEVFVIGDSSSKEQRISNEITNIKIASDKSINPLLFWHKSIQASKKLQPDAIIHCGVAGIFSYLYYFSLWNKTFINPDGLGFKRSKYSVQKKLFLLCQFITCAIFAKHIVCDSEGIKDFFNRKLFRKKNVYVAEYGAKINKNSDYKRKKFNDFSSAAKYDLDKGYFLVIARLEPENNIELIINSYLKSQKKYPLLVVGSKTTPFFKKMIYKIQNEEQIWFCGGIYDTILLQSLRLNCKAFIHGHSVGGTNPSLLEAMASKNLIFAHNNPFNLAVLKNSALYFNKEFELTKLLDQSFGKNESKMRNDVFEIAKQHFSWENICNKYINIINNVQ
jgi:rhamnosyltransferase